MLDDHDSTRQIAWLALGLFVAGLLIPFALYAVLVSRFLGLPHQLAVNIAAGVGAACVLLGLILGVVGWRHPPGKVAAIGSGVEIGLIVSMFVAFVTR